MALNGKAKKWEVLGRGGVGFGEEEEVGMRDKSDK